MANPRIDKRSKHRLALRKQTGLHLLGDCQVVRSLALRFQLGRLGAALCLQSARRLIELNQRETVSIHIFKNRSEEHTSELQSRRDLVCRLLLEKKNRPHIHVSIKL